MNRTFECISFEHLWQPTGYTVSSTGRKNLVHYLSGREIGCDAISCSATIFRQCLHGHRDKGYGFTGTDSTQQKSDRYAPADGRFRQKVEGHSICEGAVSTLCCTVETGEKQTPRNRNRKVFSFLDLDVILSFVPFNALNVSTTKGANTVPSTSQPGRRLSSRSSKS